jgi:outer membrane lipoprotein-sorting protein
MFFSISIVRAQDALDLVEKVKVKIEQVKDYEASGTMKTNVPFLKVPVAEVTIYFKNPDKLKIKNPKGISLVPKGAVSMSLGNLMANKRFTAIPSGAEKIDGIPVKVVKLLPLDDSSEIVLSTLYIDEARLLILKARTTTRENGTYELTMQYGKFASYALPDRAVFTFNTKEYKLPKGVTFDYDDGSEKKANEQLKTNKGMLEITYKNYIINKGVADAVFK